jgi:SAM-dependent methyltransferase
MITPAPAVDRLGTDPFVYLTDAVTVVGALAAARRLGVLDRLDRGAADAATVAADCGLTVRGATLVLDALVAVGALSATGDGRYRTGALGAGDLERLLTLGDGLPEALRTGVPAIAAGTPDGAGRLYPTAVAHIGSIMADAAAAAAEWLAGAGSTVRTVLDVGAGAAPWSIALAREIPGCHVTALELPAVLPATRAAVAAAGFSDRYRFVAADVLTADLPADAYDLVLVGNLCHLFDGPANQRLLTTLATTLRPGGMAAILDLLPDTPAADRRSTALYALGLFARTCDGGLHTFAAYREWLVTAGLTPPGRHDLSGAPPITLVHARRADAAASPPAR